ncbi:MAG: glycine cleavage system protein GcvH [Lentisphaeria bacterium]|nr:glycine cleavage system protein GcvH [Lentisphaeria bacterium]
MEKYYSKTHEWVKIDGDEATVGISDFAAKELGDITYVELPKEDTDIIVGDALGSIESFKGSSDFFSPVSGIVIATNRILDDDPGMINVSAEEKGWICRLDNIDLAEVEDLMEEDEYMEYLETLQD